MKFCGLKVEASQPQDLVSLAQALAQLHLEQGFDDVKASRCLDAAFAFAEDYLWQSLREQTITASYEPDGNDFAELLRADFKELVSVSYFDGALHNIDPSTVSVDNSLPVARAYFKEPAISGNYFAPIKISYKTKAPANTPEQIRQAILIATAQFYDDRDAPDLSSAAAILDLYKIRNLL